MILKREEIQKIREIRARQPPAQALKTPFFGPPRHNAVFRALARTYHNFSMHFPSPTTAAARTLNPIAKAQINTPKAQESNFNNARVVRGSFLSVGSKFSIVVIGVGRLGIFKFPLMLLSVLGLVAVAAIGDTDVRTGNKLAGADSSSSVCIFVFDLDLDFFPGTLRRERTDHGRF